MSLNKNDTNSHFNNIAVNFGVNEHGGNVNKLNAFKHYLLPPSTDSSTLECGGGGGFYTLTLLKLGYRMLTVDLSEEALKINTENAKKYGFSDKLTTIRGDFNNVISSLDNKVEQVLFIKVLHHFDSLGEINQAITLAFNKLDPGGRIIVFEPNGRNSLWKWYYSLKKDKSSGRSLWFYEQNTSLITAKNLSDIAENLSTEYQLLYKYVLPGFFTANNNRFSRFLAELNRLLERSFFKHLAFNLCLVIDKQDHCPRKFS